MKRESFGWVVAGIIAVLCCTLGAMQQQVQVGRFQLMEGRYQVWSLSGSGGPAENVDVWRIDTATGAVSKYTVMVDGTHAVVGFMSCNEVPTAPAKK
jgi:hypothetical protein